MLYKYIYIYTERVVSSKYIILHSYIISTTTLFIQFLLKYAMYSIQCSLYTSSFTQRHQKF